MFKLIFAWVRVLISLSFWFRQCLKQLNWRETFRNSMVSFSSRSFSGSTLVPWSPSSSHQHQRSREFCDDTCHSGWIGESRCTSLHETSWHSFCDSRHCLDLELKMVYRDDKRKSHLASSSRDTGLKNEIIMSKTKLMMRRNCPSEPFLHVCSGEWEWW